MPSYELDSTRCTKLFLIYVSLTILSVSGNTRFYEDRFKSLAQQEPWSIGEETATQDSASSEYSPSYARYPASKSRETFESSESFDRPNKEWFLASASKRVPLEDKHFKKIISPFYTITDKDSQKYRDIVMKSGIPYCQEIRTKKPGKDGNTKDSMTCYKCKNPKNGATYEQCSYASQPSGSSNQEEDPAGFRNRRSNSDESYGYGDYKRHDSPYRFNERIFTDASEVPAENKDEKCEKVFKDSMVCMVCKNTKSNAKYEQCSYVRQPSEKRYAFSKSSSFKNPERKEEPEESDSASNRKESQKSEEYESPNCKEVERDSKTCTVCKEPGTGGNYEKCSYSYQPNDKVYKFSSSKSFGGPGKSTEEEDKPSQKATKSDEEYKRDYSVPENYEYEPLYGHHAAASENSKSEDSLSGYARSKSESERVAQSIEPTHCKEVQKGSLSCKVCKDPKTGSNSEQCSYEQQPTDKNYSYSKSKSFGSPTRDYEEPRRDSSDGFFGADGNGRDTRESSSDAETKAEGKDFEAFKKKAEIRKFLQEFQKEDRSNCEKLMRGKMTCYQCVDDKGFRKEECAFITDGELAADKVEEGEVPSKKVPRSTEQEPEASASENVEANRKKETGKEAEPYEYVAETRPVYDEVLGITLPAYMLTTSQHEEEFDKIVASDVN